MTGAGGFIGGHAEAYARARGHEVVGRFERDVEAVLSIASGSEVSESLAFPKRFIRNNVDLTVELLEKARRCAVLRHFIHLSTSEVYGPRWDSERCSEWDSPTVTHSPYAASKAAQEAILMAYWKSFGVPVTIVNTMNVFGERQRSTKFIPATVERILRGEEVVVHEGTRRRWIHADSVADALLYVAQGEYLSGAPDDRLPQRYHVAGEAEVSMETLARMIAAVLKRPLLTRFEEPTRPGHGGLYRLDGRAIYNRGWRLPRTFAQDLERTVLYLYQSA